MEVNDCMADLLKRYERSIARRDENSNWVDLVCNHYTPLPLQKGRGVEALMFRINKLPQNELAIEIQWDDGTCQIINEHETDSTRGLEYSRMSVRSTRNAFYRKLFFDRIDMYYMFGDTKEDARIEKRETNLSYIRNRKPLLVSRLFLAHYKIATAIAEQTNATALKDIFERLGTEEEKRMKSIQKTLTNNSIALDEHSEIDIEHLLRMDEGELGEALRNIDKMHTKRENETDKLKSIFLAKLECLDVDNSTIEKDLAKMRDDVLEIFSYISIHPLLDSPPKLFLMTKPVYNIAEEIATLLVEIALDSKTYGDIINSESGYRIRIIIQQIYRAIHDGKVLQPTSHIDA